MKNRIQVLSNDLINLIAAGEVVERPASVVKELVENSLDAGATKITVNIANFGRDLIEVLDDGVGMNKVDAELSLKQHATSKIKTKEDLEGIMSLGFRGEALASISSVCERIEIETKTTEDEAILLKNEVSNQVFDISAKSTTGTRISVYGLFKNIPARLKFLKTDQTELSQIISTFLETAIPFTDIHFELYHNGKLLYRLSKTSSLKNRLFEVFGKQIIDRFFEAEIGSSDLAMVLLKPEHGIGKAKLQYSYINNRFIKSTTITSAVMQAYKGYMHRDLKPEFFIFLKLDPKEVDVNVHPRKLEAKFGNSQFVFNLIYGRVKDSLEKKDKEHFVKATRDNKEEKIDPANEFERFLAPKPNKPSSFNYEKSMGSNIKSAKANIKDALNFTKELYSGSIFDKTDIEVKEREAKTYNFNQVFNTYITFENSSGELVFIDQHAAAEKVAFDKLLLNLGKVKTKPLLVPEVVELSSENEKENILAQTKILDDAGFKLEDFKGKSLQITEIPEFLEKFNYRETILELLDQDKSMLAEFEDSNLKTKITANTYLTLATIACHGSIRAGQVLTKLEMENLVQAVLKLEPPFHCPHGRPVIWKLSKKQIEKNFSRDL